MRSIESVPNQAFKCFIKSSSRAFVNDQDFHSPASFVPLATRLLPSSTLSPTLATPSPTDLPAPPVAPDTVSPRPRPVAPTIPPTVFVSPPTYECVNQCQEVTRAGRMLTVLPSVLVTPFATLVTPSSSLGMMVTILKFWGKRWFWFDLT
jgi:hypothetical protein